MRRDEVWNTINGQYIKTTKPTGYDVLINGTDRYLNFNAISGNSGYGFRDNGGTMEFKNSGGSWTAIGSGGGGGTIDGSGTANELTYWVDVDTIGSLAVATYPSLIELTYVKGVTSSIQTQLNGKLTSTLTSTNIFVGNGSNVATGVAMSGDATMANTGALTIANSAVTYAKMQDVSATARVLGRVTAGSGDVEEIVIDTDLSSVSASDDTVASAKAIKTYVDSRPITIFSANYAADVAAAGVSRFLALTSAVLPDSGTENQREFPLPVGGTAKNFYFTTTTAQSGTGSLVLTIRKNGADTAIVITIAAGSAAGQFSDTTNTESFAVGDTLSVKVTNNASVNSAAYNGASLAFY